MKRKPATPTRATAMDRSRRKAIVDYYQDILLAVFLFMLKDKERHCDVKKLVAQQLVEAQLIATQDRAREEANSGVISGALHDWYRNAAYLDSTYQPKAMRLLSGSHSVVALILAQDKKVDAIRTAREMVRLGLLRKHSRDRYLPVGRVATIRRISPALIEHVARSLERLLATVDFNVRGRARRTTLIERTAFVHDLPREELRAFRVFAQRQGTAFLSNADEWLESRRVSRRALSRVPLVRAGIHVYAFEEKAERSRQRVSKAVR